MPAQFDSVEPRAPMKDAGAVFPVTIRGKNAYTFPFAAVPTAEGS